jgi:8-oxo-dGTP pyrophosphatase MutT (NUDIX family)
VDQTAGAGRQEPELNGGFRAEPEIIMLDRAEIAVEPYHWQFAQDRGAEIARYFDDCRNGRPGMWNGRVLLAHRLAIAGGVLRGGCFETDFASFLAWREWGFPGAPVFNIFGPAALRSCDGAWLAGEMSAGTASAGKIYFPCGTPDRDDIRDGRLDIEGSVGRELREETGLDIAQLKAAPGWIYVRDRCYAGMMKVVDAADDAVTLRRRILRHLAGEANPELSDIHILRGPADIRPSMPRFMAAFLRYVFGGAPATEEVRLP